MLGSLFLFDSRCHPFQFLARACDLALRLFLTEAVHLRQGCGESSAGATQNGHRHFQVALHSGRGRPTGRQPPLRFQKQFRLGQHALADHARALPPGSVELSRLPRVAMLLHEGRRHSHAVFQADPRHRNQILHRQLRPQLSFPHLLLDAFRQQLHQGQPPRHPTHAAVEATRQLL
jgi:hypothetical protein